MSSSSASRVRFSNTAAPRGILKTSDTHGRDSGIGSSSSDHTGSSSGDIFDLDHPFTARDYNIQSNDVSLLQELQELRKNYEKLQNDHRKLQRTERQVSGLYRDECAKVEELEKTVEDVKHRMGLLDTALDHQNQEIENLKEANMTLADERDKLAHDYKSLCADINKEGSAGLTDRMRDRINRDAGPSSSAAGPRPPLSRSAQGTSDHTSRGRRLSITPSARPHKEKRSSSTNPMSPTTTGYGVGSNYHLAPADLSGRPAASVASNAGSHRESHRDHREHRDNRDPRGHRDSRDYRESGDYVVHPLPDRTRR
ncbi:hypothetical protein F5Y17DRAFT_87379 [Xylariaceae sp. FL0594]|nr:hypothetical protein F5Y17DRAFT_87379 [Xylariaceae sp. FL0594]